MITEKKLPGIHWHSVNIWWTIEFLFLPSQYIQCVIPERVLEIHWTLIKVGFQDSISISFCDLRQIQKCFSLLYFAGKSQISGALFIREYFGILRYILCKLFQIFKNVTSNQTSAIMAWKMSSVQWLIFWF